jgi:hypothetical protein
MPYRFRSFAWFGNAPFATVAEHTDYLYPTAVISRFPTVYLELIDAADIFNQ